MAYQQGESGNRSGRPKGACNRDVAALRKCISAEDRKAVITEIIEQAKGGDPLMARLFISKLCPALVPKDRFIEIPMLAEETTLVGKINIVLDAIATGMITIAEGSGLISSIGSLARVIESEQLTERITALEAQVAGQ